MFTLCLAVVSCKQPQQGQNTFDKLLFQENLPLTFYFKKEANYSLCRIKPGIKNYLAQIR
jgi:hypothetical protein